jgi:hypothetical protein
LFFGRSIWLFPMQVVAFSGDGVPSVVFRWEAREGKFGCVSVFASKVSLSDDAEKSVIDSVRKGLNSSVLCAAKLLGGVANANTDPTVVVAFEAPKREKERLCAVAGEISERFTIDDLVEDRDKRSTGIAIFPFSATGHVRNKGKSEQLFLHGLGTVSFGLALLEPSLNFGFKPAHCATYPKSYWTRKLAAGDHLIEGRAGQAGDGFNCWTPKYPIRAPGTAWVCNLVRGRQGAFFCHQSMSLCRRASERARRGPVESDKIVRQNTTAALSNRLRKRLIWRRFLRPFFGFVSAVMTLGLTAAGRALPCAQ